MTAEQKDNERAVLQRWLMNIFVVMLAASIPFGIVMTFYANNAYWLWFCAPILIFLS